MSLGKKTGGRDFKKGQSGNPGGRPKREWTWSGLLKKILQQKSPNGKQWKTVIGKVLVAKAATGDVFAIRELFNRMEGFPKQSADVTSGNKPIPIIDVFQNFSDKEDS